MQKHRAGHGVPAGFNLPKIPTINDPCAYSSSIFSSLGPQRLPLHWPAPAPVILLISLRSVTPLSINFLKAPFFIFRHWHTTFILSITCSLGVIGVRWKSCFAGPRPYRPSSSLIISISSPRSFAEKSNLMPAASNSSLTLPLPPRAKASRYFSIALSASRW